MLNTPMIELFRQKVARLKIELSWAEAELHRVETEEMEAAIRRGEYRYTTDADGFSEDGIVPV